MGGASLRRALLGLGRLGDNVPVGGRGRLLGVDGVSHDGNVTDGGWGFSKQGPYRFYAFERV